MIWFALLLAICAFGLRTSRRLATRELQRPISILGNFLAFAAVMLGLLSCIAVVPAGHVGVATVFGKVQTGHLSEGLNLVNPFAHVEEMSVRTETYTMSSVSNEGQVKGDDSIQALSSDGLMMPLDITVAYRLVSSDGPWLYRGMTLASRCSVHQVPVRARKWAPSRAKPRCLEMRF